MTAYEAKAIADKINKDYIDKIDIELSPILSNIQSKAELGQYHLNYFYIEKGDYNLKNDIKNQLIKLGFKVEITNTSLSIDWSNDNF